MNNIIVVGVLDVPVSSNLWMASAFQRAGFNVIPVNYRTIVAKYSRTFFKELLIDTVKKYKPELTLFCKCNSVEPLIFEECNLYSKTWLFYMDLFEQIQTHPELLSSAKNCTISSATSEITVQFFKQYGVKNCIHMFEGTDPHIHKIVEPEDRYLATISFIGTKTEERDKYKILLEDNFGKDNVKFYGYGYSDKIISEDWAKICSSSRFMLSMNTYNNYPTYFSGRLFELLGSGACTFHLDNTGTLEQYFQHGVDLFYFKDKEDLIKQIKSVTEEQEIAVRASGYKKVQENHTWDIRVKEMMKIVKDSSFLGWT